MGRRVRAQRRRSLGWPARKEKKEGKRKEGLKKIGDGVSISLFFSTGLHGRREKKKKEETLSGKKRGGSEHTVSPLFSYSSRGGGGLTRGKKKGG